MEYEVKECGISEIPASRANTKGWVLTLDGRVTDYRILELKNPKYGTIAAGQTPGGYDSWAFHEIGGGGSVSVPYTIINGKLFIGVVAEKRPNLGGIVLNVPRGFLTKLQGAVEKASDAAKRELQEETGLSAEEILGNQKSLHRDSAGVNMNSAFFVTVVYEEGVHFFAAKIRDDIMSKYSGERSLEEEIGCRVGTTEVYRADKNIAKNKNLDVWENIYGLYFIPWEEAVELRDIFTIGVVGKLIKLVAKKVEF